MPLVRVATADGRSGWGEGWSRDNETAPFHARLAQAGRTLIGAAPRPEAVLAGLAGTSDWAEAAVASALDIALWDLLGQARGVPLHALLGGAARAAPVYASGGLYADDQDHARLGAELRLYVRLGFRAVKLKIGALGLADDLARVAAVRAAIGPDNAIIVDALSRLPRDGMMRWVDGLAALGVRMIQAPLPLGDAAGLAAIQRDGRLAVLAGETEFRPAVLEALGATGAVGVLQPNAALCGGLTGVLRLARATGLPVTPQCHGTAVLQAASLHLGAGCDAVSTVEFHMFHAHLHAALPPAMRQPVAGAMRLDDRPGLGLDTAALACDAVREVVSLQEG